jgi:hypothetical protein
MINPNFLLQAGPVLSTEKYACRSSGHSFSYCPFDAIKNLDVEKNRLHSIPVGSVEFVKEYCDHVGIRLPTESLTYLDEIQPFIKRAIRKGIFKEAKDNEFVKPVAVKTFTGDIKSDVKDVLDDTPVWISEQVRFESEFRFYILTDVIRSRVTGWSRYDDLDCTNPDPDPEFVFSIAEEVRKNTGPNAFSIDIGWRPDLKCYDVVELNDAWSLGLYNNTDPQSCPPSAEDYAEMLISRWAQTLFCNL